MNIVIIPSRRFSKRIRNKNFKLFLGKPIIQWTIENLKKIKFIDKIIVSTDSHKIAKIAENFGAEVPFLRPKKIADDFATTNDVMQHAVKKINYKAKYICCVYPTSVFIDQKFFKKGYETIKKNNYDYVFSVTESVKSIDKYFIINKNKVIFKRSKYAKARTQDLNKYYFDAGQFYWGKFDSWYQNKEIFSSKSFPIKISNWKTQDIDTINDWKKAEVLMKTILNENNQQTKTYYLKIIDQIEKVRSKNNVNWMDILRIAFKHSPEESRKLLIRINKKDNIISNLFKDLEKK